MKHKMGLALALLLAGCAVPNRASVRVIDGKFNPLTRSVNGLVVTALRYCEAGTKDCRAPSITLERDGLKVSSQ